MFYTINAKEHKSNITYSLITFLINSALLVGILLFAHILRAIIAFCKNKHRMKRSFPFWISNLLWFILKICSQHVNSISSTYKQHIQKRFTERNIFLMDTARTASLNPLSRMEYGTPFNGTRENTRTNFYCDLKLEMCICSKITY